MENEFYCGVMVALGYVYEGDQETLAEEIVRDVGASDLLRVAKANEDIYLPNLRRTIRGARSASIARGK